MEASSDELAKGVNLTVAPGPVTQQGRQVLDLVFQKNNVFFNSWRQVQLFSLPAWAQGPELESRMAAKLAGWMPRSKTWNVRSKPRESPKPARLK